MLTLAQVSKAYGDRDILDKVSLSVTPGERVALVGRNGCGKTTLLRIIAGLLPLDSGVVALGPGCRIGYLGQEGQLAPDRTLHQEMLQVFAHVLEWEQQLRELETRMEGLAGSELDACLRSYGELQARYDHAEAHTIEARVRTVCAGMGFTPGDMDRLCAEFSGGWQMRGAMARVLLDAPDLLLLDEPTNHLDVSAVEWLEVYLSSYAGAVVIVSHDRAFIDRAVNRVVELSGGELEEFAGNYTYYLEESENRFELQLAAYKNQQKKLVQDRRFIERFRYKSTLATRVKSREKMLERREMLDLPDVEERSIKISFEAAEGSGRETLTAKGLAKAYGARPVLSDVNGKMERGQRVALVGRNGAGKSTLLRLLASLEQPDAGRVIWGYRVAAVYYAQHQAETLNMSSNVLEEVRAVAPRGITETSLRTLLGCLLFRGDDVFKPVGVLSGGERSRVALARCLVTPSNMMLLDEPTNHLDIAARESLVEALLDYPGSLVLITHDRWVMDQLATNVWEVANGKVRIFEGNYDFYRRTLEREARQAQSQAAAAPPVSKSPKVQARPVARGESKPKWKLEALEKKIFSLEEELKGLTDELADPALYKDPAAVQKTQQRFEGVTAEHEELMAVWEAQA